MEQKEDSEEVLVHRVFKNDPIKLMSYVYKLVEVKVVNGKIFRGWVKTVDPVSESVVLVDFNNEIPSTVQIIMGHTIESIEIISSDILYQYQLKSLFNGKEEVISEEELNKRKKCLRLWLTKHRLPINEDNGIFEVAGCVKILPPYTSEHCVSTNEIILGKIQGLLSIIPENIEEWD